MADTVVDATNEPTSQTTSIVAVPTENAQADTSASPSPVKDTPLPFPNAEDKRAKDAGNPSEGRSVIEVEKNSTANGFAADPTNISSTRSNAADPVGRQSIPATQSVPREVSNPSEAPDRQLPTLQDERARTIPAAVQPAPAGRGLSTGRHSLQDVMPISILRSQPHHAPQHSQDQRQGQAQGPPRAYTNGPPQYQNFGPPPAPPQQHVQPPQQMWHPGYPPPGTPWMTHCPSCGFVAGMPWPPAHQTYQQHPQPPKSDPRANPQVIGPQHISLGPLIPLPDNSIKKPQPSLASGQVSGPQTMSPNGLTIQHPGQPNTMAVPQSNQTMAPTGVAAATIHQAQHEHGPAISTTGDNVATIQGTNIIQPRQTFRRLTTDERRDILLMRRLGYTVDVIAKYLDASPSAVAYTCKRGTAETNHHLAGRRINMPQEKMDELCTYVSNYMKQQSLAGRNRKTGKKRVKDLSYAMIRQAVFTNKEGEIPQEWRFTDEGIKKTLNRRGIYLKRPMTYQQKERARVREKARWVENQQQLQSDHRPAEPEQAENPLRSDSSEEEDDDVPRDWDGSVGSDVDDHENSDAMEQDNRLNVDRRSISAGLQHRAASAGPPLQHTQQVQPSHSHPPSSQNQRHNYTQSGLPSHDSQPQDTPPLPPPFQDPQTQQPHRFQIAPPQHPPGPVKQHHSLHLPQPGQIRAG